MGKQHLGTGPVDVSVVVPTYNSQYLEDAIASVYAQTVQPSQVIVVNDGSSDDTERRLASLAPTLPSSFFWQTKPNGGNSSARNFGVRLATGDYVAFLDADDLWHPSKLERQLRQFASDPDLALSFTGYDYKYSTARQLANLPPVQYDLSWDPDSDAVLEQLLFGQWFWGTMSTVVVRRDILARIPPFNERLTITGDVQMFLDLAVRRMKIDYLNAVLVAYRQHDNNITRDVVAARADTCAMYDSFLREHLSELPQSMRGRARKLRARWHMEIAIDARRLGNKAAARRHILTAACRQPRSIRPGWVRMVGLGPAPKGIRPWELPAELDDAET